MRHHTDLAEIEERTKIRVRYLRALENEEWDLLPGPTYTRSFIRTYASFLGLDGERLADDFRRLQEDHLAEPPAGREPRAKPPRPAAAPRRPRLGAGFVAALIAVALLGVLLVLGLTGNSNTGNTAGPGNQAGKHPGKAAKHRTAAPKPKPGVSIQLTATGEVWVCALAANGTPVVNGQILTTGTREGPFHSNKFDLRFGNGEVTLQVNGKLFPIASSSSPVDYQVTSDGVRPLPTGSGPTCA